MIRQQLNALNNNIDTRERNSLLRKFLPLFLVLSFMLVELFETYSSFSAVNNSFISVAIQAETADYFFISLLISALLSWAWFEIVFYIYRMFINFSIFSYTIPRALLENKARCFMVLRNVIFGLVSNLMFFFPYIRAMLIVFQIIIDFLVFIWFAFAVTRETVDTMIMPNVFKGLLTPFVIIEGLSILIMIVEVL